MKNRFLPTAINTRLHARISRGRQIFCGTGVSTRIGMEIESADKQRGKAERADVTV